ncbi:MAG: tetratricopeptide repeat protein [bacterium]
MAHEHGDYEAARRYYEESITLFRDLGNKAGIAMSLNNLGEVALKQGDLSQARSFLKEATEICRDIGDKLRAAESLEAFAYLNQAEGKSERAAQLFGAADALREILGAPLPPNERADYDRTAAAARTALSNAAFEAAFAAGRALPLDAAIAYALEDDTGDPSAGSE